MDLISIAQSWYQLASADGNVRELMERRLKVCDGCKFKRQLNWIGELILTSVNESGSQYHCGACKCPLGAKTSRYQNQCPKGYWLAEKPPQGYY